MTKLENGTTTTLEDILDLHDLHKSWSDSDWPRPDPIANPRTGTVCIVGKSFVSSAVPWGADDHEFWGLNDVDTRPGNPPVDCHTRWFQLHPPRYLERHYPKGIDSLRQSWGEKVGIPLYMDAHYDWLPDSVPYPKEEVEALTPRGWYHTSSFSWMVALAILEGWSQIELYGIDFYTFPMLLSGEPVAGRPCLEYWLGVAEGRGIGVEVIGGGDMFRNIHVAQYTSKLQYGFEREPALDASEADANWSDVR